MAVCSYCDQEMVGGTKSCSTKTVTYPDGATLPSIPHVAQVEPQEVWMHKWRQMVEQIGLGDDSEEKALERYKKHATGRCYSCLVADGGYHHPGCGGEACPRCGGQLIGCGCLEEEDEEECPR